VGTDAVIRFFLDTEFIEDSRTIDLVSIGVVAETGEEFYAVSTEAQLHLASPWVRQHVLPKLPPYDSEAWMTRNAIKDRLYTFVERATCVRNLGVYSHHEPPEFWADHASYDWVALCQLFGTMMQLPTRWPQLCLDLEQLRIMKGSPQRLARIEAEHDALYDARYARALHHHLDALPWPERSP
jgi:3' exoribonuclease, RNase T-like